MTCAEFQHDLPEFIESGGKQEQMGHLNTCPICSDLVQDLKYIADAARLLVPMHDPSPTVWQGIEQSLRREGLRSEERRVGKACECRLWAGSEREKRHSS